MQEPTTHTHTFKCFLHLRPSDGVVKCRAAASARFWLNLTAHYYALLSGKWVEQPAQLRLHLLQDGVSSEQGRLGGFKLNWNKFFPSRKEKRKKRKRKGCGVLWVLGLRKWKNHLFSGKRSFAGDAAWDWSFNFSLIIDARGRKKGRKMADVNRFNSSPVAHGNGRWGSWEKQRLVQLATLEWKTVAQPKCWQQTKHHHVSEVEN